MPSITGDLPSVRAAPHVTSAELDDTTLTVAFDCAVSYTVVLPEDYPRGEPYLILGDDMESLNAGRLDAIVRQLWNRAVRQSDAAAKSAAKNAAANDPGTVAATRKTAAIAGHESPVENTDSDSGDDAVPDFDDDDVLEDDGDHDGDDDGAVSIDEDESGEMMTPQFSTGSWQRESSGVAAAPALMRDVESVNAIYGPATADTRVLDDTTRVFLDVPLAGVIDRPTATAFGAEFCPIAIEMKFSTSLYTEQSNPPTFTVTQNGEKFALGQQLHAILVPYLKQRWSSAGWTPLEVQRLPSCDSTSNPKSDRTSHTGTKAPPSGFHSILTAAQRAVSRQLVDMGFTEGVADVAAAKHGDVDAAVAALLEDPKLEGGDGGGGGGEGGGGVDHRGSAHHTATSTPTALTHDTEVTKPARGRGRGRGRGRAAKAAKRTGTVQEDDPVVISNNGYGRGRTIDEEYRDDIDPKKLVRFDPSKGFLAHLVEYVQTRVRTACDFCVICDKPHAWSGAMLRPTVCARSVCVFAFQELDVGADAADDVAVQGGVIDLLITIFKAAVKSTRADQILDPFPHVFDPDKPKRAVLDPQHPDLELVRAVVDSFPALEHVVGSDSLASLRLQITKCHRLAFPLLSWVIHSNRSLLVKVDDAHRLSRMGTQHQFMLVMAPPEKQAAFDAAKKEHGTKYAFHGSRIENWHAILRNGLRNCSGTSLQLNGAGQGSGIYSAQQARTSIGYCQGGQLGAQQDDSNGGDLIDSDDIVCLALCEIVSDAINDHGWCWTVADEAKVMTRFFFVFSDAQAMATGGSATTSDDAFTEEIVALQEYYGAR